MQKMTEHKRCAIYTRKSCDDGLELKYNSLDAQYDACSAYIRSQIGMGWELIDKRYDDGGYSGGSVKRPALQELLKDIEKGKIDAVVVYKIDRLSRSIFDFADLFKIFAKHNVDFISITQQIDTSTAAGRMMLNILMSFAQFEREMSSDRVRDKFYESRKNGLWCGGVVPYGYVVKDKQLMIEPIAAKAVKYIFERYPEIGSSFGVASELNTKHPRLDGSRWNGRKVLTILRNVIYTGVMPSRRTNEEFPGAHEAIITEEAFKCAKAALEDNSSVDATRGKVPLLAPLKGLLRCGTCGSAMSPSYSRYRGSKNRRYVYYRCSKSAKGPDGKCEMEHISGDLIEKFVFLQLEDILRREEILEMLSAGHKEIKKKYLDFIDDMNAFWDHLVYAERVRFFRLLIKDILVWRDKITITFTLDSEAKRTIPCSIRNDSGRTCVVSREEGQDDVLSVAKMFRKSHSWLELMTSGTYANKRDLAAALGVSASYVTKILRFQFLSPKIIEAIRNGSRPDLSVEKLSKVTSVLWEEQERMILGA